MCGEWYVVGKDLLVHVYGQIAAFAPAPVLQTSGERSFARLRQTDVNAPITVSFSLLFSTF